MRNESKIGREIQLSQRALTLKRRLPGAWLPGAIVAQGVLDLGFGAAVHREETSAERDQGGDQDLRPDGHRNDPEALQDRAHQVGDEPREPIAGDRAQRHGQPQRDQTIGQDQGQIHAQNLGAARAYQLHDPNLAQLLGQQGIQRIDDEGAAQNGDQTAQGAEHANHRQNRAGHRVFARKFFVHPVNFAPAVLQAVFDRGGDTGDSL